LRGVYKSSYLAGTVYSLDSVPLKAGLVLVDLQTQDTIQFIDSDQKTGAYTMVITPGAQYALSASANGYVYHSESLDLRKEIIGQSIEGHDIYLKPLLIGSQFELENIFFETASYDLDDKSNYELDLIVQFLKRNSNVHIEVRGYTDNVGDSMDNRLLSSQRAKAVTEYLRSKGIYSSRLQFKGLGEDDPVASNDSPAGRALNRRIEFRVIAL
jgi:outer membrane protein OmpA-like peptidoglycan-associated protein